MSIRPLKPLVSCLCLTRDRRNWLPQAIACFRAQTYEPKELIIVADGQHVGDLVPDDPSIHLHYLGGPALWLGPKRNVGVAICQGEFIAHWDDDDWSAPERLQDQVERLQATGKAVTGYTSLIYRDFNDVRVVDGNRLRRSSGWWKWTSQANEAAGTSLCYRRYWWKTHRFPAVSGGEDDHFWKAAMEADQAISCDGAHLMIAHNHPGNITKRMPGGIEWEELPGDPREAKACA